MHHDASYVQHPRTLLSIFHDGVIRINNPRKVLCLRSASRLAPRCTPTPVNMGKTRGGACQSRHPSRRRSLRQGKCQFPHETGYHLTHTRGPPGPPTLTDPRPAWSCVGPPHLNTILEEFRTTPVRQRWPQKNSGHRQRPPVARLTGAIIHATPASQILHGTSMEHEHYDTENNSFEQLPRTLKEVPYKIQPHYFNRPLPQRLLPL